MNLKLSAFGGAGIGLLFGVIMGTSVTPTVATVLGALTAILTSILGLNDSQFSDAKAARIGSFGFACVIGAYTGLFVRSHNVLSPSLMSLKHEYIAIGFSNDQALNYISQKEFGVMIQYSGTDVGLDDSVDADLDDGPGSRLVAPDRQSIVNHPIVNQQITNQHSSLLFSAPVELSGCDEVIYTDDSLPLDEVINNFELTGDVWEELALYVVQEVPPSLQKRILLTTKDAVCSLDGVDGVEESSCAEIEATLAGSGLIDTLVTVSEYSPAWDKIVMTIDSVDLTDDEKILSLTLSHLTLCGFSDE